MYKTYNARPIPRPHRPHTHARKWLTYVIVLLLLVASYVAYSLYRPLGQVQATILPPVVSAQAKVQLPWPVAGQAAFGADGYGLLATNNEQKPTPTASVTKVITALSILEKKPLRPGETGPMITLTDKDVALYNEYVAMDGAVVPVSAGEKISEYQALQAMMLPSANNIADTAAIWAFGSLDAYTSYANTMVRRLGMSETIVSDASGFSPKTVSTARDLIRLGDAALDHPVLAEIVSQKESVFPGYGTITNVNNLLGQAGIRGIKTGNTEEAGGCYLAAADIMVGNTKITVITAIMGSTSRPQAMRDSIPIIQASTAQFARNTITQAGQVVGRITSPWGQSSDLVAQKDITVPSWKGTGLSPQGKVRTVRAPVAQGDDIGSLTLQYGGRSYSTSITAKSSIQPPSVWWRLANPL